MKWLMSNYTLVYEAITTDFCIILAMFISFLVLTIQMLFANEGGPYIFINMKPTHTRVKWKFTKRVVNRYGKNVMEPLHL